MHLHCNTIAGIIQEKEQAKHEQTTTSPLLKPGFLFDATEY